MQIEKVVKSFQKRVDYLKANCPEGDRNKLLYNMLLMNYFEDAMNARKEGKLLGWAGMTAPVELLTVMGVVPFKPEQYVIQNLASGEGLEFIEVGAGYGFNRESCSTHVALVGLAKKGLMPVPDFTYHNANPCDSGITLWDVLPHIYQCPSFFLDYPYHQDEGAEDYLRGELEGLVRFMEEQTGSPMDEERLARTVELCHAINDAISAFQELRKTVPSPIGGRHALNLGITQNVSGTPQLLEFVRTFYEETAEKVQKGKGAIPEERYRILWLGGMPYYDYRLIDWMEEEFGAVMVADGLNIFPHEKVPFDTSDPLAGLARLMNRGRGGWALYSDYNDKSAEAIVKKCQEYKVDAAINFVNFGCKQFCGPLDRILREDLRDIGVAKLTLDGDINDPSVVPVPQMRAKVKDFFAMLDAR